MTADIPWDNFILFLFSYPLLIYCAAYLKKVMTNWKTMAITNIICQIHGNENTELIFSLYINQDNYISI